MKKKITKMNIFNKYFLIKKININFYLLINNYSDYKNNSLGIGIDQSLIPTIPY